MTGPLHWIPRCLVRECTRVWASSDKAARRRDYEFKQGRFWATHANRKWKLCTCSLEPWFWKHVWANRQAIEWFHSRGQHLCKYFGTKEIICIRKEFISHRTGLGHQHGRRFIVLGHQYGRSDVMWKHSIRVKTLSHTNLDASRNYKREKKAHFRFMCIAQKRCKKFPDNNPSRAFSFSCLVRFSRWTEKKEWLFVV